MFGSGYFSVTKVYDPTLLALREGGWGGLTFQKKSRPRIVVPLSNTSIATDSRLVLTLFWLYVLKTGYTSEKEERTTENKMERRVPTRHASTGLRAGEEMDME